MTEGVVEAEVIDEPGTDLAPVPQSGTLFRTDDPAEVAKRATEAANALKSILQAQGLTTQISGREHVRVEGWQTLGAMLGVTPVCTWTRKIDKGWEARVEARTLDGRVIGAAEAMCTRDEGQWKQRDDYAIRSMAQTRATSKALASPLRFVVTLAGYDGTPAEEMPREGGGQSGPRLATDKQKGMLRAVAGERKVPGDVIDQLLRDVGGVDHLDKLPMSKVDDLKAALEAVV